MFCIGVPKAVVQALEMMKKRPDLLSESFYDLLCLYWTYHLPTRTFPVRSSVQQPPGPTIQGPWLAPLAWFPYFQRLLGGVELLFPHPHQRGDPCF